MTPTLFEIGVALVIVSVTVFLIAWFWRYKALASERRMTQMLTRAGVAPELVRSGDSEAIIKDVRSRCRSCPSEDLCDRWLAGEVEGDNGFCPNAQLFRGLTKTTGHAAP
jgi:hypothetical protein